MKPAITLLLLMTLGWVHAHAKDGTVPGDSEAVRALLCGVYDGRYNQGVERLVLKPDGTFSQTFVRGDSIVYRGQGRWRLEKFEDHFLVLFEPFIDSRDAIMNSTEPKEIAGCQAHFYADEPTIWFFREIDYYVTKTKESNPKDSAPPWREWAH